MKDDGFDLSAALEKAAFVERGDIWTVGRHRLMCGDATSAEDVAALMDGKKAKPYRDGSALWGFLQEFGGLSIQNDSMKGMNSTIFCTIHFYRWRRTWRTAARRMCSMRTRRGLNFRKAFVDAGFHLAGVCIWVKNSLVLGTLGLPVAA